MDWEPSRRNRARSAAEVVGIGSLIAIVAMAAAYMLSGTP